METLNQNYRFDAVYLHYLDRELNDAATERPPDSDQLVTATRILTLLTQSELYVGLSAIWENDRLNSRALDDFEVLFRTRQLQTVSRDLTRSEFLSARTAAYSHDQARYPNYFTPTGKALEWLGPTWQKPHGSTKPLLRSIEAWSNQIPRENLGKFQPTTLALREPIQRALILREDEAITYSFFKPHLGDLASKANAQYTVRRQISKGFTLDNMRHGTGDIATGITGLEYFDQLSLGFPQHDIPLLGVLGHVCGLATVLDPIQTNADLWARFVEARVSRHAQLLAETVRWLLTSIHERELTRKLPHGLDADDFYSQHQVRRRVRSALLGASRARRWPEPPDPTTTAEEVCESAQTRVSWLADKLSEQDAVLASNLDSSRGAIAMDSIDILLVTVNDIETASLKSTFQRAGYGGRTELGRINTYTLYGPVEDVVVGHVRSGMGSLGTGGSTLTVIDAIRDLRPRIVLGVGVAFGVDESRQPIGTLLLSQKLTQYEQARIGEGVSGEIALRKRGPSTECSPRLLGRFRDMLLGPGTRVWAGEVLSGEKLIDHPGFKAALISEFPDAIGGEMEGCGIQAACDRENIEWIIIKGVCDYAVSKGENKLIRQRTAAKKASQAVLSVIQDGGLSPFSGSRR